MKVSNSLFLLLFVPLFLIAQQRKKADFGNPTLNEFNLTTYENDPEAAGVVLFESGETKIKLIDNRIRLIKEVHRKIKVLDAKNFQLSTVDIPLYKSKSSIEKITFLKAITHNNKIQSYVAKEDFYDIDVTENWTYKRFTFSNIKDGSILEYKYTILSPYFFNFGEWTFQNELPTLYSEFSMEIPGNFLYHKSLIGKHPLYINEASLKNHCFSIPGTNMDASCEIGLYAMVDIPAYEDENYMLSKTNYINRLDFELKQYTNYKGEKEFYTKRWKDVDSEYKHDKNIGRQLFNKSYFKNHLSESILTNPNELEKAKAIYKFIKDHYTWNGSYRIFNDSNVKDAFVKKSGSIAEINLSLINALQAADLDAKIVLHSTRENGLPTKAYPVITDFNYILALLTIGEEKILLDATEKFAPFGILPFRTLNKEVRVMDYKKGSYWLPIQPHSKNINYINAQITFNEDESITGNVNEIHTGYHAITSRKSNYNKPNNDLILEKENNHTDLEVTEYSSENESDLDLPYKEKYKVIFDPEITGTSIYINPFIFQNKLLENPFKNEKRQYPIDFGYPSTNTYLLKIDLNNQYEVVQLPTSKSVKLPEGAGSCTVAYSESNGSINVRFNYKLNEYNFSTGYYESLKEFFSKVIEFQTKETIVIKKI